MRDIYRWIPVLFVTSFDHYQSSLAAAKKCTCLSFFHLILMWPFILTRTVTLQRKIQASKAEVLAIIQNPDEALRLSPLQLSVVQDDKDPAWYTITDRLPDYTSRRQRSGAGGRQWRMGQMWRFSPRRAHRRRTRCGCWTLTKERWSSRRRWW